MNGIKELSISNFTESFSPTNVHTHHDVECQSTNRKSTIDLIDLGSDVLVKVLSNLHLRDRLTMATVSTSFRDFIYNHNELWPNLSAIADSDAPLTKFNDTLHWASQRHNVLRLRTFIRDDTSSPTKDVHHLLNSSLSTLARSLSSMNRLISLNICIDVSLHNLTARDCLSAAISAAPTTLRQLCIVGCDIQFPTEASKLTALTALALHGSRSASSSPATMETSLASSVSSSGGGAHYSSALIPMGVTFQPNSLPTNGNLKHLSIGGLGTPYLPQCLAETRSLESLSIDWATEDIEASAVPDFSLLESESTVEWSSQLTHLSLGYYQATSLPSRLPASLRSLCLQWNVKTSEGMCKKALDEGDAFDVDAFHASFSALEPLTGLKHLNLNNALGGWGLPPSVQKLTQLESLGVVGNNPLWNWHGRKEDIAAQLSANFKNLRQLDMEVYEAAAGWQHLAGLTGLEQLRLGRGESPEAYVSSEVREVIGSGLVKLLPSLPNLKKVCTEGMLLPATGTCGRWNRLLGFELPELRHEATAAVDVLYKRGVALERWYAWPFIPGVDTRRDEGLMPWDAVV